MEECHKKDPDQCDHDYYKAAFYSKYNSLSDSPGSVLSLVWKETMNESSPGDLHLLPSVGDCLSTRFRH